MFFMISVRMNLEASAGCDTAGQLTDPVYSGSGNSMQMDIKSAANASADRQLLWRILACEFIVCCRLTSP